MIVHFIRHGKTAANLAGRISGARLDLPLSVQGVDEIRQYIAAGIYPKDSGACYTSDLIRTQQTLSTVYPEASFQITSLLRERDFGMIEYETDSARIQKWRDERYDTNGVERQSRYDGGETTPVFRERVHRDFTTLMEDAFRSGYSIITICGHGGYLREIGTVFHIQGFEQIRPAVLNAKGLVFRASKTETDLSLCLAGFIGGTALGDVVENRQ